MIHPETFEDKTGFTLIREMLLKDCRNDISRALVREIKFSSDPSTFGLQAGRVEEYARVLNEVYGYPDPAVHDFTALIASIRVPGSWFEPEELPDFLESLTGIRRYLDFFLHHAAAPLLGQLSEGIEADPVILQTIVALLNDQGEIRDSASPELAVIRKEIIAARLKSERVLRKVLKEAIVSGILPKDTDFTVKDGRFVIPVPAARKRQLRGYVHDESATGQTLFIEPAEVVEIFNNLRELELAERREIIRIMISLADLIRPHIPDLLLAFGYAGMLDFIRAKARFAIRTGGRFPQLTALPHIEWKSAVHPLLHLALKEQQRAVVPLDITLNSDERILVISGPNAGGKSVCLKTVGLLQYMLQCGMLIPMQPHSVAGVFSSIFIDIGDEQSIENDLSTYSSHLLNLKKLLSIADPSTLFLIDEMGSGTEPTSGGAIAEAALEMIAASGACGVVTTHYANLKLMAGRIDGIINGAMLFDARNMQPLYKLRTGKPGSSFAFEIAGKIGMPEELLSRAREKVGEAHYDFDVQMQNLETEKEELDRRQNEMKVADAFLAEMIGKYTMLYQKLDGSKKEIILEAKREAKLLLEQSNKLIEKAVKDIREAGAKREEVKTVRESLQKEAEKLIESPVEPVPIQGNPETVSVLKRRIKPVPQAPPPKPIGLVKPGDFVSIRGHNSPGEVLRVEGAKASVAFGTLTITLDIGQLAWASAPTGKKSSGSGYQSVMKEINDKSAKFKPEIDIRGVRAEEALRQVMNLVDDAILLNFKELKILHGKGDGILRQVIRDYLSGVREVKSYRDEHIELGGHGITLVSLK